MVRYSGLGHEEGGLDFFPFSAGTRSCPGKTLSLQVPTPLVWTVIIYPPFVDCYHLPYDLALALSLQVPIPPVWTVIIYPPFVDCYHLPYDLALALSLQVPIPPVWTTPSRYTLYYTNTLSRHTLYNYTYTPSHYILYTYTYTSSHYTVYNYTYTPFHDTTGAS